MGGIAPELKFKSISRTKFFITFAKGYFDSMSFTTKCEWEIVYQIDP